MHLWIVNTIFSVFYAFLTLFLLDQQSMHVPFAFVYFSECQICIDIELHRYLGLLWYYDSEKPIIRAIITVW